MSIKAIPTRYKGYHFRSMSEARWAVFMDHMGVRWGYEVQGFETPQGAYLPDFRVETPKGVVWLEVKGPTPAERDIQKLNYIAKDEGWWSGGDPHPIKECGPVALMVWGHGDGWTLGLVPRYLDQVSGNGAFSGLDLTHFTCAQPYEADAYWGEDKAPKLAAEIGKTCGGWLALLTETGLTPTYTSALDVEMGVIAARSARFDRGQTPT